MNLGKTKNAIVFSVMAEVITRFMANNGARGLGNRGALDALNAGSIPAVPTLNGDKNGYIRNLY